MKIDDLNQILPASVTRRRLLVLGVAAAPLAIVASACSGSDDTTRSVGSGSSKGGSSSERTLSPTPACGDDVETPAVTEGPFFESGSPERTNIRDGDGTALVVSGAVMSTACQTLANAKLDFWHADGDGEYDNDGYNFRGHQFTDSAGRYRLETIVPAIYPGRTRHIHVKVQPEGGDVLTTQLYFPDEQAANERDDLFREECLMDLSDVGDGKAATFSFVVEV